MCIKAIASKATSTKLIDEAPCKAEAYDSKVKGAATARDRPAMWIIKKRTNNNPVIARGTLIKFSTP